MPFNPTIAAIAASIALAAWLADHKRIGKFSVEYDAGLSQGFDFCMCWDHTNKQFGYTIPRQFFAVWWARRCDAGIMLFGKEYRRQLGRKAVQV